MTMYKSYKSWEQRHPFLTLIVMALFGLGLSVVVFLAGMVLATISVTAFADEVVTTREARPLEGDRSFNYSKDDEAGNIVITVEEIRDHFHSNESKLSCEERNKRVGIWQRYLRFHMEQAETEDARKIYQAAIDRLEETRCDD